MKRSPAQGACHVRVTSALRTMLRKCEPEWRRDCAIGHPLGMSGVRIALTAAIEMNERKARRALATMCIGVGQGIAVSLESVK